MPRKKSSKPNYVYHVSGQARVYLDGRYFYLGEYDSPESHARFFALCDQYSKNGQSIPEEVDTSPDPNSEITVRCVTASYRAFAGNRYSHDPNRLARFENLCDTIDDEYADHPAKEFGPRKLEAIRDLLIATTNRRGQHNTRTYINGQVSDIVRIFAKAVSRELIPIEVVLALKTLDPLIDGESAATESDPVQPVSLESVRLTAVHLSPPLRTMVLLQVATGMRPSELFRMCPCHIETTTDDEWIYRPPKHKTTHKKKTRAIPIVGHARKALESYVTGRPVDQFCFMPEESAQWYRDQRSAKRTTPLNQGDRPGYGKATRDPSKPKRKYNPQFTKDSYARAIKRAAEKAGVGHWFPYQLRHTNASAVCDALGIEFTQALLGHSKQAMAEHYARTSLRRATEAARVAPEL